MARPTQWEPRRPRNPLARMARFLKNNGLTLTLMAMFAVTIVGQWLTGWRVAVEDLRRHGQGSIDAITYLADPMFISTVFENWESEFLQMAVYVVLTAFLVQRGSSESKNPDAPERDHLPSRKQHAPGLARVAGPVGWLYSHSLGLALGLLFVVSFVLHWTFSARAARRRPPSMARRPGARWPTWPIRSCGSNPSRTGRANSFRRRPWWCCRSSCAKRTSESKPVAAPDSQTGA